MESNESAALCASFTDGGFALRESYTYNQHQCYALARPYRWLASCGKSCSHFS